MGIVIGALAKETGATLITSDGKPITVSSDHPKWDEILEKIQDGEYDGLAELASYTEAVSSAVAAEGFGEVLYIKNGEVYYKGHPLRNSLGEKLLDEMRKDKPLRGFVNFARKLVENPSNRVINELYAFRS